MTGCSSADLLPESPSSSSVLSTSEHQLQTPESPKISPNSNLVVDVKKPVFGTIQTRNGPMVFSVLAPGTLANLASGKKPVMIKSTFYRHVRFSVKYFGREVSSWNFRAKSMCRLTSEKKPMDVKYPNPIYNERKMSKVKTDLSALQLDNEEIKFSGLKICPGHFRLYIFSMLCWVNDRNQFSDLKSFFSPFPFF